MKHLSLVSPELSEDDLQEAQSGIQLRNAASRQQPIEAFVEQLFLRQVEVGAGLKHLRHTFQVGAEGPPEGKFTRDLCGFAVKFFGRLIKRGGQPARLGAHIQASFLERQRDTELVFWTLKCRILDSTKLAYLEQQQQGELPPPDEGTVTCGAVGREEAQQLTRPAGHVLQLHLSGHHQKQQQEVHETRLRQILHLLRGELGINPENKRSHWGLFRKQNQNYGLW